MRFLFPTQGKGFHEQLRDESHHCSGLPDPFFLGRQTNIGDQCFSAVTADSLHCFGFVFCFDLVIWDILTRDGELISDTPSELSSLIAVSPF